MRICWEGGVLMRWWAWLLIAAGCGPQGEVVDEGVARAVDSGTSDDHGVRVADAAAPADATLDGSGGGSGSVEIDFQAARSIAVGAGLGSLVIADFDRDGKPDFAGRGGHYLFPRSEI